MAKDSTGLQFNQTALRAVVYEWGKQNMAKRTTVEAPVKSKFCTKCQASHPGKPCDFKDGECSATVPETRPLFALTYRPQIFVFGSNAQGIHGAGSARYAVMFHGAILGQGSGFQGKKNQFGHIVTECYGIITCKRPCHGPEDWITLAELKVEI